MITQPRTALYCSSTRLERLDECVKEDAHAPAPPQKLHQPGSTKKLEETDRDHLGGVNDAAHNRDEVEYVPPVVEIVLKSSTACNLRIMSQIRLVLRLHHTHTFMEFVTSYVLCHNADQDTTPNKELPSLQLTDCFLSFSLRLSQISSTYQQRNVGLHSDSSTQSQDQDLVGIGDGSRCRRLQADFEDTNVRLSNTTAPGG